MDGEVDRVLMKKEEVVMTEEEEQVFIEQKQVVETSETVEEQWSLEKGEVVMTEEVEQVFIEQKQVVETSETVEQVFIEQKQVVETSETVEEVQWSQEKGEVARTEEVKQVAEVNETVVERWSLEKEDVLEITKTIIDQWLLDKSEDQITNFNGNKIMGKTRESCEALVEYEKAVRKFLTHTTDCSKCVDEIKKDVPRKNTISILFVIGFIVQFVQLFISSVVNNGGLLRRARFIIKQSYESVVTRAYVFLYKTQGLLSRTCRYVLIKRSYVRVVTMKAYVSIKRTLQRILIKQQHHAAGEVIVTPSGVTNQGLIRRTRFVLEQSYESVVTIAYVFIIKKPQELLRRTRSVLKQSYYLRVVTMKAYVSIKQTLEKILFKQHTYGVVITKGSPEEVHDGGFVDQSTPVVVTPSGVDNHTLIRRTRLVLKQSYESVVTRLYVFLQETQGLLRRTKIVLMRSSVRDVTIKAYISVKQILNWLLIKLQVVVTPSDSNNTTDSKVQVRRLFFFGVISVLLCLSGTQFMVNQEYHIAVTTKANFFVKQTYVYWFPTDQLIGANVNKVVDIVVIEQKDDSQTDDHMVKEVADLVVVEQKDAIQTDDHMVKEVVDLVLIEQKDDHVVMEVVDLLVVERKDDSQTDDHVVKEVVNDLEVVEQKDDHVVTEVVDLVVIEQKDDSQTDVHVVKEVVDLVVIEQKVDSETGIHVVKEVVDLVVVEQKDGIDHHVVKEAVNDLEVVEQKDDHVVTEVVDLVVIEQKDDSQTDVHVVKEVVDLVVIEQKDDSQTGIHVVKEVVDLVVVEQKDDTDHHTVKEVVNDLVAVEQKDDTDDYVVTEVVDLVVVEQKDDSQTEDHVVKEVVDLVVIEQKDDSQTGIHVVKEVVDLVVVEQEDDTDHHAVKEVVDLVGADQSDGSVVSNEVDSHVVVVVVQEKDVERLLKTWINYAVTLVQKRLIKRVYFIAGISILFSVFFCVYNAVVGTKLRLGSWTTIHVTTRVQTELLRIWSAIKLEKVLNVKVFGHATKKLLHWLRHLVSKEEILKSIVYGGLTEIIASISIVAFFADFDTTILNVIAFALAGLIGGCFFFVTNIWELKKGGGDTYREQFGRVNYFPFHATLAMLSFIIFGMIPPSTFVFSFLKTNDKKIAIWVVSAVSLLCLSLLAIFKAYVTSTICRFKYVKTVLWYHLIAMGVSICSYLASKMVKGSIEDLGLFDTSTCDAMSRHN